MRVLAARGRPARRAPVELALEFPVRPAFPGRQPQVEFPFVVPLAAAHDEEVVAPGQFSQQCCENWLPPIGLEKLHHPPEITGRVAANIGLLPADVLGQGFDRAFSPTFVGDLSVDEFADAPVKLDQSRVNRGDGSRSRVVDQVHDDIEIRLSGLRCGRPGRLLGSFPRCFLASRHAGPLARANNAAKP